MTDWLDWLTSKIPASIIPRSKNGVVIVIQFFNNDYFGLISAPLAFSYSWTSAMSTLVKITRRSVIIDSSGKKQKKTL